MSAGPEHCDGDRCITCGDVAVEAVVTALLPAGMAYVDAGAGDEEVSVALVDAHVGDVVLVHAKEAIGLVPSDPASGGKPR